MLYLQDLAKQDQNQQSVTLSERLPAYILAPCTLDVHYKVEAREDFYLIYLQVQGIINIVCQRCLNEFAYNYDNKTEIAACADDKRGEELLGTYESVIAQNWKIDLETLVVDELYLYAPQFHLDINDCDSAIKQFLIEKNETF